MTDTDLCERCGIMDGSTVYDNNLVCLKCDRKLKKEARQLKREIYYGRKQRVRQKAPQNLYQKRPTRNPKSTGRGK